MVDTKKMALFYRLEYSRNYRIHAKVSAARWESTRSKIPQTKVSSREKSMNSAMSVPMVVMIAPSFVPLLACNY
jgi:hypothetical protein